MEHEMGLSVTLPYLPIHLTMPFGSRFVVEMGAGQGTIVAGPALHGGAMGLWFILLFALVMGKTKYLRAPVSVSL